MVTQLTKESNITDLITTMNSFDQKLTSLASSLASREYIENVLQKLVTQDVVKKMLKEVKDDISKHIKGEIGNVQKELKTLQKKVEEQSAEITELNNNQSDMQTKIEKLTQDNGTLINRNKELKELVDQKEAHLKKHEKYLNDLEQYTRLNSVRIYGVNDTDKAETSTKTITTVVKVFKNKLDLNIAPEDVDTAHRLGQFREDGNRPIIVKFVSREVKHSVIKSRRKLKGSAIVIREDLTQKNARVLEAVSRTDGVKMAWSSEGKIFALLANGRKARVGIDTDISSFLNVD